MGYSIPDQPSHMEKTMRNHILAAGLLTFASPALAQTPVLTVLTYDSFAAEWGRDRDRGGVRATSPATCALSRGRWGRDSGPVHLKAPVRCGFVVG